MIRRDDARQGRAYSKGGMHAVVAAAVAAVVAAMAWPHFLHRLWQGHHPP